MDYTTKLSEFLTGLYQQYHSELQTGGKNEDRFVVRQKIDEIDKAIIQTFETEFVIKSNILRENLFPDIHFKYAVSNSLFAGNLLIETIWPIVAERAAVITEVEPFSFLSEHIERLRLTNCPSVYFIEDIRTGIDLQNLMEQVKTSGNVDILVGIGGGRPMDILKFIGLKTGMNTVALPTSLTSHVYASPKIHALHPIRDLGYDLTINGFPPDLALLDLGILDILDRENPRLIRAGFGDIIAFYTACRDWQISVQDGFGCQNYMVQDVIDYVIQKLETLDIKPPLRDWIMDYHLIQVLLCHVTDWVGSAPASGSEHLFALCAEDVSDMVPLHGELVALGSLIMSYIQGKDYTRVKKTIDNFSLPLTISEIGITRDQAIEALLLVKDFGRKKQRYTILEKIDCNRKYFDNVIDTLLAQGLIGL